ncbi:MAG TPA: hypothetical protein VGO52_16620, partial [Hyphomonadaceae bacterium]|nr:hypothetical protein [Hyphomonadaceae bacterium]
PQHEGRTMPIIKAADGTITQINVFATTPESQQALISILAEAAKFSSATNGWRSASLHRSLDGTKVANYAQTDSLDAMKVVFERLSAAGFMQRTQKLGTANPGLFEVVFTLER